MADDSSTLSWNDVADDWIAHADANDYRNHYLMPRMLAMLQNVADKAVDDRGSFVKILLSSQGIVRRVSGAHIVLVGIVWRVARGTEGIVSGDVRHGCNG